MTPRRWWIAALTVLAFVAGSVLVGLNLPGRTVQSIPPGTGSGYEEATATEPEEFGCEDYGTTDCPPLDLPIDEQIPFEETPDDPTQFWDPDFDPTDGPALDPDEAFQQCVDSGAQYCFEVVEDPYQGQDPPSVDLTQAPEQP